MVHFKWFGSVFWGKNQIFWFFINQKPNRRLLLWFGISISVRFFGFLLTSFCDTVAGWTTLSWHWNVLICLLFNSWGGKLGWYGRGWVTNEKRNSFWYGLVKLTQNAIFKKILMCFNMITEVYYYSNNI